MLLESTMLKVHEFIALMSRYTDIQVHSFLVRCSAHGLWISCILSLCVHRFEEKSCYLRDYQTHGPIHTIKGLLCSVLAVLCTHIILYEWTIIQLHLYIRTYCMYCMYFVYFLYVLCTVCPAYCIFCFHCTQMLCTVCVCVHVQEFEVKFQVQCMSVKNGRLLLGSLSQFYLYNLTTLDQTPTSMYFCQTFSC